MMPACAAVGRSSRNAVPVTCKTTDTALNHTTLVIVDDHRRQAGSYKGLRHGQPITNLQLFNGIDRWPLGLCILVRR